MNHLDVTPMPLANPADWLWNPFMPVTVHGLYIPMSVAENITVDALLIGSTHVLVGGSVPGTSFAVPGGVGIVSFKEAVLVPGMSAQLRVTRKNDWKGEGQAILYVTPIRDRKMIERYAGLTSDPPHPDGFGGEDYPNAPATAEHFTVRPPSEDELMAELRGEPMATTTLENFAKWLAWSDRSNDIRSPGNFSENADRYWNEHATPQWRGQWMYLAASLLGINHTTWRDRYPSIPKRKGPKT